MKHVAAVLLCLSAAGAVNAQVRRPNLIVLIADRLRYDSCGYAGDEKAITPNVDRLAGDGISFDNYVVNTPVCAATRATLWTGKYASTHGMVINELRLNPNHDALGHLLTAKGYTCDYIGKWHLWANQSGRHQFAENAYCPPGPYRLGFDGYWAASNFNRDNFKACYFRDTPQRKEIVGWAPELFTNMAIGRIEHHAASQKPFAMVLSYSPPDDPWTKDNVVAWWYDQFRDVEFERPSVWSDAPDRRTDGQTDSKQWVKRWNPTLSESMRVYYAMTAALDEQIGRVLKALEDFGMAENTIVIFTSVRGAQFGAEPLDLKMTFQDKSARVPMLMRWPGKIPAGRRSNACLTAVDILPTICGMLGVGYPDSIDGIDLSDSTRVDCSCEPDFAFLQGMGHTSHWTTGAEWRAVRDQHFTYARYHADGAEWLFDNKNDPQQSVNLAGNPKYAGDLKRLRQWMAEKMLAVHDEFRPCPWYRDHWTENRVILRGANGVFQREMGNDVTVDINLKSVSE